MGYVKKETMVAKIMWHSQRRLLIENADKLKTILRSINNEYMYEGFWWDVKDGFSSVITLKSMRKKNGVEQTFFILIHLELSYDVEQKIKIVNVKINSEYLK